MKCCAEIREVNSIVEKIVKDWDIDQFKMCQAAYASEIFKFSSDYVPLPYTIETIPLPSEIIEILNANIPTKHAK